LCTIHPAASISPASALARNGQQSDRAPCICRVKLRGYKARHQAPSANSSGTVPHPQLAGFPSHSLAACSVWTVPSLLSAAAAPLPNILDRTPPAESQPSPSLSLMNSMNTRFKNLVGSKRKSSSHNPSPTPQGNPAPTSQQRPTSLSPQASNSSSSSLPMNPQNPMGRPPSYTYAPPGGLGAPQQQHGRPASPLPPINTGAPGYPPQQTPMGYPPQGGPPGYPAQGPPGAGQYGQGYGAPPPGAPASHGPPATYNRPSGMAEVAGEGRSKAQLIVGIDFVSSPRQHEAQQLINPNRAPPSLASHSPLLPTPRPRKTSSPNGLARVTRQSKRYAGLPCQHAMANKAS
jgi:hypothetical protein